MKKAMNTLSAAFLGLGMMATSAFASGAASSLTTEEQAEESKNLKIAECLVDGIRKLDESRIVSERQGGIRITQGEFLEQFAKIGDSCLKREDYSPEQARSFLSRLGEKYGQGKVDEIIADRRMLALGSKPQ